MCFGLFLLAMAFTFARPDIDSDWVATTGRVVDTVEVAEGAKDRPDQYRPVVEFQDHLGRTHTVTGRFGARPRPKVGSALDVAYDPADPADAAVVGGADGREWIKYAGAGAAATVAGLWVTARSVVTPRRG